MEADEQGDAMRALLADESNKKCADCSNFNSKALNNYIVNYLCIKNGIFLCAVCAMVHSNWEDQDISHPQHVLGENWTNDDIRVLRAGGNANFSNFISQYEFMAYQRDFNLPLNDMHRIVFFSKAAHYWRLKLEAVRNQQPFTMDPPDLTKGQEA